MSFRFRHSISVSEGVRLVKGQRVINLSDLTRAKAWSDNAQEFDAPLTLPSSGLHYATQFDNSRAHQHRAYQRREWQKWQAKSYELAMERLDKTTLMISALRPSVDETGKLVITTATGERLSDADITKLNQELPQVMRCWTEELAAEINGPLASYVAVPLEAPNLESQLPSYKPVAFADEQPQRPEVVALPPEPVYPQPPAMRLWHKFIPGRQQKLAREHQNAVREWQTAKLRWKAETHQVKAVSDRSRQRYKAYLSVWKARKLAHEAEQQVYAEQFATLLLNDESLMTEVLLAELNQLDWPVKTSLNFQLDLNRRTVWLDVELPTAELISKRSAEVMLGQAAIAIRQKSAAQQQQEYVEFVYASLLRLVGVLLGSLPAMTTAVVSGYTQRQDHDTGFEQDEFLLSISASRECYSHLNLADHSQTSLSELISRLNPRVSLQQGCFQSIQPYEPEDTLP